MLQCHVIILSLIPEGYFGIDACCSVTTVHDKGLFNSFHSKPPSIHTVGNTLRLKVLTIKFTRVRVRVGVEFHCRLGLGLGLNFTADFSLRKQ